VAGIVKVRGTAPPQEAAAFVPVAAAVVPAPVFPEGEREVASVEASAQEVAEDSRSAGIVNVWGTAPPQEVAAASAVVPAAVGPEAAMGEESVAAGMVNVRGTAPSEAAAVVPAVVLPAAEREVASVEVSAMEDVSAPYHKGLQEEPAAGVVAAPVVPFLPEAGMEVPMAPMAAGVPFLPEEESVEASAREAKTEASEAPPYKVSAAAAEVVSMEEGLLAAEREEESVEASAMEDVSAPYHKGPAPGVVAAPAAGVLPMAPMAAVVPFLPEEESVEASVGVSAEEVEQVTPNP
jgi:hypothetical protein